jgi:hypothetical protein
MLGTVSHCHQEVAALSSCSAWRTLELLWASLVAWWGYPLTSLWWGANPGDWARSLHAPRRDQCTSPQCHTPVGPPLLLPCTCHKEKWRALTQSCREQRADDSKPCMLQWTYLLITYPLPLQSSKNLTVILKRCVFFSICLLPPFVHI